VLARKLLRAPAAARSHAPLAHSATPGSTASFQVTNLDDFAITQCIDRAH